MLRRLALALLLLFVATPSLGGPQCHQPMGEMNMADAMHHGNHRTGDCAQADQHCIGCAIPGIPAVPDTSAPPPARMVLTAERVAPLVQHSLVPDTPPPRA
jgi:hypothetical protein